MELIGPKMTPACLHADLGYVPLIIDIYATAVLNTCDSTYMYFNDINAPLWLPVIYSAYVKSGEILQHTQALKQ